jgi:YesN/AraC family two-component response regulator
MPSPTADADITANNIRKTYLSERQVEIMDKALSAYMNDTQSFLQQGFSLPQLSKETGFQLQHVSAFLNQHLGESFNDYTNKFRVNYLISLFEQDSNIINQFTLESLGKQAGFGSRSTLINAFKKITGQTPSAYFRL